MLKKYGEVTSVEFDTKCCEFLRSELKFDVVEASFTDLPFKDKTFDSYIANYSLHLVKDHIEMLKESYRVLNDEGIATFSIWGRPEHC